MGMLEGCGAMQHVCLQHVCFNMQLAMQFEVSLHGAPNHKTHFSSLAEPGPKKSLAEPGLRSWLWVEFQKLPDTALISRLTSAKGLCGAPDRLACFTTECTHSTRITHP